MNLRLPLAGCLALVVLAACGGAAKRPNAEVVTGISDALLRAAAERNAPPADALDKALMPPLSGPATADPAAEQRFDLSVVNAPAAQVFMALVGGTRYSMLLDPNLTGSLTVTLKNVTVFEALETIRELYGYEYRRMGDRLFIEPNTMKTRVFQINYLASRRLGNSDLRVSGNNIVTLTSTGGTVGAAPTTGVAPAAGAATGAGGAGTGVASGRGADTSRVSMMTDSDFWGDLQKSMTAIIGTAEGRSVVINPSSGVLVVRALPGELRNVEKYLKATQLVAERQVMLEAKIVDVSLSEEYQSGVNWSAFRSGPNSYSGAGIAASGTTLRAASGGAAAQITTPALTITPGQAGSIAAATTGKGLIGLAFQTSNFASLLNFLETQGTVSVLSSPRIATLNNQKAVLKVGTDELFVTNVSSSTTTTGTTTTATPTLTLQPFFSGISLDVTPQIDDEGNIILHVHPAVSAVTEKEKIIDLGAMGGVLKLPLASSAINETDSIVRAQDGNIVAIGGLMRQEQTSDRSQLPGASGGLATLLGQRGAVLRKRELVILIKPTVIQNDRAWAEDLKDTQQRVQDLQRGFAFPPPK